MQESPGPVQFKEASFIKRQVNASGVLHRTHPDAVYQIEQSQMLSVAQTSSYEIPTGSTRWSGEPYEV